MFWLWEDLCFLKAPWIHPAERWVNLGRWAELFTRPQEIESCREPPRHCSARDCTHLAICTFLRRHGVYTAAEAAEASIICFFVSCFVSWIPDFEMLRFFSLKPNSMKLGGSLSPDACRVVERSVRGCSMVAAAFYLIWRILMDSDRFCPYILHHEGVFTMVSPLFGRVEELVELLVNLVEVSGGFSQCSALASALALFGPPKMMLYQLCNGSISPEKDTMWVC